MVLSYSIKKNPSNENMLVFFFDKFAIWKNYNFYILRELYLAKKMRIAHPMLPSSAHYSEIHDSPHPPTHTDTQRRLGALWDSAGFGKPCFQVYKHWSVLIRRLNTNYVKTFFLLLLLIDWTHTHYIQIPTLALALYGAATVTVVTAIHIYYREDNLLLQLEWLNEVTAA